MCLSSTAASVSASELPRVAAAHPFSRWSRLHDQDDRDCAAAAVLITENLRRHAYDEGDGNSSDSLDPGDWNAFFGFGTNILVNMLVLTGLLHFVLKMPDSLVFGRILPALGLMMCLSTFYHAWLAYRLAAHTKFKAMRGTTK
jgi:hypothetical protein